MERPSTAGRARGPGLALACLLAGLLGCGAREARAPSAAAAAPPPSRTHGAAGEIRVPASPQRPGDPRAGYRALLSQGYVGCGVPWSQVVDRMGDVPDSQKLPGRPGVNADLPYAFNVFTTRTGAEVMAPNCLACHAGFIDDELVIGLGNIRGDFTRDPRLPPAAMAMLLPAAERDELRRWLARMDSLSGRALLTVGVNPADTITALLFAHRDPATLAWSDEPLLPLPAQALPLDVPPWWNVRKKHALYYTAAGRGDHARMMMLASVMCVDTVEDARAIDSYFPDIRAYIASLEPPPYPGEIDRALAARGRGVFEDTCAECHGTYGPGGAYPNRVIPIAEIGTDPLLAGGGSFYAAGYLDWFERSFYGEISDLRPERGYIAPPLDGVWASAPYFHNGSVPTVRAVLDSASRPASWRRHDSYDHVALGWRFERSPARAEAPEEARRHIYDTREPGYASTGHRFGDALSDAERAAVIEYLKTL